MGSKRGIMKECATCLKTLPDTDFYKSPRYRCRDCHRAYVRAWQARNKERVNAANQRYRERKKEKLFDDAWNLDIESRREICAAIALGKIPGGRRSFIQAIKEYSDAKKFQNQAGYLSQDYSQNQLEALQDHNLHHNLWRGFDVRKLNQ